MNHSTWYKCEHPTKHWENGEYLIARGSEMGRTYTIWHNNSAAVSGLKTIKAAIVVLHNEFNSITKIDR